METALSTAGIQADIKTVRTADLIHAGGKAEFCTEK